MAYAFSRQPIRQGYERLGRPENSGVRGGRKGELSRNRLNGLVACAAPFFLGAVSAGSNRR
jgi:hypothetical protein